MQACLCVGVCGCGKHFEIWIQMNFCVTNEKTKNSIDYMDYFLVEHKKKTTNHLNMMVFFSFCLLACFIPQRSNWMKKRMKSICYRKQKTKIYWFIIIIVIHHTFYSSYIYILTYWWWWYLQLWKKTLSPDDNQCSNHHHHHQFISISISFEKNIRPISYTCQTPISHT